MTEKDTRKLLDRLGWKGKLVKHIIPLWGTLGSIGFIVYFSLKGKFVFGLEIGGINFGVTLTLAITIAYILAWWYQDFPWTINEN